MSAGQPEPCEHRRPSGLVNVDYGDEPCPICEAEERKHRRFLRVVAVAIAVSALVSGWIIWSAA